MKKIELMEPCPYQVDGEECMGTLKQCKRIPDRCVSMLKKWQAFCRDNLMLKPIGRRLMFRHRNPAMRFEHNGKLKYNPNDITQRTEW